GNQQKAILARWLLTNPEYLILDEPTAGLDPRERVRFRNIISALGKDRIVILSTHIVSDIEYIADQIMIMKQGRLIQTGTPTQILEPVAGCVWNCIVSVKTAEELNAAYAVSNLRNYNGNGAISAGTSEEQVELRIVSKEKPHPDAVAVEPVLEDAYLYYYI
ncbi:MAG: ABC transporter ATP-binding protein, partial [Lachnospiraceae bacterium]|nr:ABC transporter ATP-binding protein [Lachnospiraceae bacterium]